MRQFSHFHGAVAERMDAMGSPRQVEVFFAVIFLLELVIRLFLVRR